MRILYVLMLFFFAGSFVTVQGQSQRNDRVKPPTDQTIIDQNQAKRTQLSAEKQAKIDARKQAIAAKIAQIKSDNDGKYTKNKLGDGNRRKGEAGNSDKTTMSDAQKARMQERMNNRKKNNN